MHYLTKIQILAAAFLIVSLFGSVPAIAQDGANTNAVFILDFSDGNDTQTATALDAENKPVFLDSDGKTTFTAVLVLQGAQNLVGVNCDLEFDPAVLAVVDIHESQGDINFDGRANIADVLTLAERFNQPTDQDGYAYFDLDSADESAGKIDSKDIEALVPFINQPGIFWTNNANSDLSQRRESVDIFESPDISNQKGKIDDIVTVLLSTVQPIPDGFGFDGDARIAEITFEVIGDISAGTSIKFTDTLAIDEATEITATQINNGSVPQAPDVLITQ